MKSVVIGILVIVFSGLGFLFFTKNRSSNIDNGGTISNSSSTADSNTTMIRGKTLDLSDKGLTTVPDNRLDDNSVIVFDVSENNLTGALPAEIRKLTNLEVLIAYDNNMTGIPAEIGQLSKLREVNFANNNISGLPLEIGNLKNLETFDLRGNPNVSEQDLSQLRSKLPNTKFLVD